jgi:hypothetical protein
MIRIILKIKNGIKGPKKGPKWDVDIIFRPKTGPKWDEI